MTYQFHVRVDGQDDTLALSRDGDIADLVWELQQQLRARHPALADRPYLTAELVTRVLPSLIHDPDEVNLGDL